MSEAIEAQVECPVVGCEGLAYEHENLDQSENIHRITGPEIDAVMTVDLVMAETYPRWVVDVYTWGSPEGTAPLEALEMAQALTAMSARCTELNSAVDAILVNS
jgi:hypothetical protein